MLTPVLVEQLEEGQSPSARAGHHRGQARLLPRHHLLTRLKPRIEPRSLVFVFTRPQTKYLCRIGDSNSDSSPVTRQSYEAAPRDPLDSSMYNGYQ